MATAAANPQRDFWADHRVDTEARVVEAYLALLDDASALTISMPAVAERAGLSVRTLYRYFESKADLQRAASRWLDHRALAALAGRQLELDSLRSYLTALWADFAAHRSAVREQHATSSGRAVRIERLPAARARIDAALDPAITGDRRVELIDLIAALASSSMFLELVDRMAYTPKRAAELTVGVVELLIETSRPTREEST